jgi:hypothetical protein
LEAWFHLMSVNPPFEVGFLLPLNKFK